MSGLSNHFDSLVAVQAIIAGISLTGMSGPPVIQEVLDYKQPELTLPCIVIAPFSTEDLGDATMSLDDVGYKIVVAIVADSSDESLSLEQRLAWRQAIRRRLRNRDLGIQGNYQVKTLAGPVVEPMAWRENKFVSGFVVTASFQEPRS